MYTNLVANYLFPLHERLKGHDSVALKQQLEQSQWLSSSELEAVQTNNLRHFIQNIVANVPYFRTLFAQLGLSADAIQSVEDLQKLPLLDKPTIRDNFEELKTELDTPLRRFNTGGSSGEPLVFMVGNDRISHDVAAKWRATRWWDVDIGDPELVVWGSPVELGAQDRLKALRDRVLRTELLPAFEMSPDRLADYVERIRQVRPAMLFGYPSSLALIARQAEQMGVVMDQLDIKVAFVTSECLFDDQRETISRVFGCPVANGYGGRDAGFIAHQCPHGGLHLSSEHIVVELLDEQGKPVSVGEPGEVVVTHLCTASFPFVRYRTGDIAVMDDQPCACGRGLPVLKEVHGRTTDFIVAQDGTIMHALAMIYEIRDEPSVAHFKLEQTSLTHIRLDIVAAPKGYEPTVQERIVDRIKKRLGQDVEVQVVLRDQIRREHSGKYKYVVSHVPI